MRPKQKRRLAYLTTAYPNVSHTFIKREIQELERRGHAIVRVAIRAGEAVVDPDDQAEYEKTLHLLNQPTSWLVARILGGLIIANARILGAMRSAWRMCRASDRGILRHAAYLLEALALLSYFRRSDAKHVHVHFGTNSAAVAMLVGRLGGQSYSMTIHGPDEFDAPIGFSLAEKMQAALFTVAISNYCASQLRRWVTTEEWGKIFVVHCTVGSEWVSAACPIETDSGSIVCVGRLSAQKGQLSLIDAVAEAVSLGFSDHLYLIGDGEMRSAIEERIASHKLSGHVTITGWCSGPDVRELLLQARALVLPSFAEGLPVVIMESMALHRPVLSTFVAGIPELVLNGETGWLVPAGDHDALVNALMRLHVSSLAELREMGATGAELVKQRHFVETEVARLHNLFLTRTGAIGNSVDQAQCS